MFAIEAATMGVLFGALGIALGAVTLLAVGAVGLPATSEIQYFIYGGTRLYPELHASHLLVALALISGVTLVSSLIPAWVASRIPPIAAMQSKE